MGQSFFYFGEGVRQLRRSLLLDKKVKLTAATYGTVFFLFWGGGEAIKTQFIFTNMYLYNIEKILPLQLSLCLLTTE